MAMVGFAELRWRHRQTNPVDSGHSDSGAEQNPNQVGVASAYRVVS